MNVYDASEYAYKNGYEAGMAESKTTIDKLNKMIREQANKILLYEAEIEKLREKAYMYDDLCR